MPTKSRLDSSYQLQFTRVNCSCSLIKGSNTIK
nr:MAG TPA: hypothetical protein [Inoviridae sp.]